MVAKGVNVQTLDMKPDLQGLLNEHQISRKQQLLLEQSLARRKEPKTSYPPKEELPVKVIKQKKSEKDLKKHLRKNFSQLLVAESTASKFTDTKIQFPNISKRMYFRADESTNI